VPPDSLLPAIFTVPPSDNKWQNYITHNVVTSGFAFAAALLGKDGSIWDISPHFKLTGPEIEEVLKTFGNIEYDCPLDGKALRIGGRDFKMLITSNDSLHGYDAKDSQVHIQLSETAIVITVSLVDTKEDPTPMIEAFTKHLIIHGF